MAKNEAGVEVNKHGFPIWPKWVKTPDGKDVIVKDEKEEAAILGKKTEVPKEPPKVEKTTKKGWDS